MRLRLQRFFYWDSASGFLLIFATILALIIVNSPADWLYNLFIELPIEIRIGPLFLGKPLLLWINDGLMAIFFLLIGLELKREALSGGHLADPAQMALPSFAALGGMLVPMAFYVSLNHTNEIAMRGWAIPTATDIAFALGILTLLGHRVPLSYKIFLTTLAVLDDLGAIIIIAIFYSNDLSGGHLWAASAVIMILVFFNWLGVRAIFPYLMMGTILWLLVLKSGVHATLAGVVLALTIPGDRPELHKLSPMEHLEHDLKPGVFFIVLPLFAFANAGVSLKGLSLESFSSGVPLGIIAGLLLGKPLGVFMFSALLIKSGITKLPKGMDWHALIGLGFLCGIGFTMSLFIGGLAFEQDNQTLVQSDAVRLGVLTGSTIAAMIGYQILKRVIQRVPPRGKLPIET
uniref:Na(+)/H(+) antiporter NhaA n=1 Tax=Magnetococcus massalia (strain MO-1) TaxID=451514 RepID=A0A1S7LIN2_MAGMO|nr:Na(+)/H(+) antiporter nhaA [Candidatus Magnetococcus massalia]